MKEALAFTDLDRDECFDRLMNIGGFPEPFLKGTKQFYNRWKRSHTNLILREDFAMHYIRNKDGQEIDFLITQENQPCKLIEVKWKDASLSFTSINTPGQALPV